MYIDDPESQLGFAKSVLKPIFKPYSNFYAFESIIDEIKFGEICIIILYKTEQITLAQLRRQAKKGRGYLGELMSIELSNFDIGYQCKIDAKRQ